MARKGIGKFAKGHLEALRLAEAYMGLTTLYIKREFAMENDEITLEELTLERYIEELMTAEEGGTRAEFDEKLAGLLGPIIQQALSAEPTS